MKNGMREDYEEIDIAVYGRSDDDGNSGMRNDRSI